MSKDEKTSNSQGGRRGKGGRNAGSFKKDSKKPAKPLNSDEAVPMLKYGPNNNYVTFKDRIKTACMEKYGDLGRLIELESYWEPPKVDRSAFPNAEKDLFEKQALIEAVKERATTIAKMINNKASMYAYIMSKMSTESIDEIKRHRDHYEAVNDSVDPLELWKIVKEIHMISTKSKSVRVVKRKSCEEYYACKQGAFETLVDFKARFDTRYEAYKHQGNPEKDDEDVAMDFLESLDKTRYGDFMCDIFNDISKGVMTEPTNVNEVYVLANTRVTMKRGSNYNVGASYTTIDGMSRKQGKKGKNRQKGDKSSQKKSEKGNDASDDADEKLAKKPDEPKKKKERNLENVECFNCGNKGHYARDCPENESDDVPCSTYVESSMAAV
jgi:Zinc knuckle.